MLNIKYRILNVEVENGNWLYFNIENWIFDIQYFRRHGFAEGSHNVVAD